MERFAVIGLGRFGERLATLLAESGAEVIAIDSDQEIIDEIRDRVALAVCMDATNEEALRAQGIDKVDVAVVGLGTAFEDNALVTVLLKQLGVPRVVSRAATAIRAQILSRIGARSIRLDIRPVAAIPPTPAGKHVLVRRIHHDPAQRDAYRELIEEKMAA